MVETALPNSLGTLLIFGKLRGMLGNIEGGGLKKFRETNRKLMAQTVTQ